MNSPPWAATASDSRLLTTQQQGLVHVQALGMDSTELHMECSLPPRKSLY